MDEKKKCAVRILLQQEPPQVKTYVRKKWGGEEKVTSFSLSNRNPHSWGREREGGGKGFRPFSLFSLPEELLLVLLSFAWRERKKKKEKKKRIWQLPGQRDLALLPGERPVLFFLAASSARASRRGGKGGKEKKKRKKERTKAKRRTSSVPSVL